jgi:hypothetical protein
VVRLRFAERAWEFQWIGTVLHFVFPPCVLEIVMPLQLLCFSRQHWLQVER